MVKDVAVIFQKNSTEKLIAYIIFLDQSQSCSERMEKELIHVKQTLEKYIPHYMLPNKFISLVELPLTPNGKVDRLRLENTEINLSSTYSFFLQNNSSSVSEAKVHELRKSH